MSDEHESQVDAVSGAAETDQSFANLLEQMARELEERGRVDVESFARLHPHHGDRLRRLFPTMEALADWAERTASFSPHGRNQADVLQLGDAVKYFGDYVLLEEIARGGMGVVYKARQNTLNRVVALKMILAGELASDREVERFQAEAQAAANLDHPGIVPIFEVGQHDGRHYFSMGYIEGTSLAERVVNGPLDPREAAELVRKVARAVAYAHGQGVVHRDLKPGNVLLDRRNEPRVTDFGLAKQVRGDSDLTATGQVLGTPAYMSPEQANGAVDGIDERSDVYSLGAVLYCLLTGRPPFQASNPVDTLLQVIATEPVAPRKLNAAVPADLDTICLKCLEKDRAARYQSAEAAADDLQRFLNGEPIVARPIGRSARGWRWCKRHPAVAGLTAAVAVLAAGIAIAGPVLAMREAALRQQAEDNEAKATRLAADETAARNEAERARQLEHAQRQKAETLVEANREQLVRMNILQGDAMLERDDPAGALPWYVEALRLDQGEAEREAPHRLRLATVWQNLPKFTHFWRHDAGVTHVAISRDDRLAATSSADRTVRVWNLDSGQLVAPPFQHALPVWCSNFSPDGKTLVTASGSLGVNGEVRLWNLETGKQIGDALGNATTTFFYAAFTESGRLLTVETPISGEGTVRLWDAASRKELASCPVRPRDYFYRSVEQLVDAPRGRVFETADRVGRVVDLANDGRILCQLHHDSDVQSVCFSNDGSRLLTAERNQLHVWDAATGKKLTSCTGFHSGWSVGYHPTLAARFSLDNERVTLAGDQGQVLQLLVATGQLVHLRSIPGVRASRPIVSDDGRFVAHLAQDKSAHVWDARSERRTLAPLRHASPIDDARFTGDTRRLVTGCADGSVRVWEPGTIVRPYRIQAPRAPVAGLALSPDGKEMVIGGKWWMQRLDVEARQLLGEPLHLDAATVDFDVSIPHQLLAYGTSDASTQVLNYATGKPASPRIAHAKRNVRVVRISPDGRFVGTIEVDLLSEPNVYFGEGNVWRIDAGERVVGPLRFPGLLSAVVRLEFSPDSQLAAISGGSVSLSGIQPEIVIVDLKTGRQVEHQIAHSPEFGVGEIVFDPTSRFVATGASKPHIGGGGELCLWDLKERRPIGGSIPYPLNVHHLTIDGNSRYLAAVSGNLVHVLRLATGEAAVSPLLHDEVVEQIQFSENGQFLLTATRDGSARIWNIQTGQLMTSPLDHPSRVTALRLIPGGPMATACEDGLVRFWNFDPLDRPWPDLQRMARLLSANLVSETQAAIVPALDKLEADWDFLRQKYPEDFQTQSHLVIRWHDSQVTQCWNERDWHSAVIHFERTSTALSPNGHGNYGHVLCEIGDFERAIPHFDKAIEMEPQNSTYWLRAAAARLHTGDLAAYRETCRKMLTQFADADDPWAASDVVKICLLAPNDFAAGSPPFELARRAARHSQGPAETGRIVLCKAIADFRAERFEEARTALAGLVAQADDPVQVSLSKYFLAMTLYRAASADEAVKALADADDHHKQHPIEGYPGSWLGRALVGAVQREARALIKVD